MNISELIPSQEEIFRILSETINNDLRVCCPGIIQSFDKETQTVTVQLALREQIKSSDTWINIPPLVDVPIVIPRAGGYALTMPIKKGDECLVMFADVCIDAWYTHGGIQNQMEKRRHDLSDGFAILGTWSQPRRIKNYSTESMQLRNEEGTSCIELKDGLINLKSNLIKLEGDVDAPGISSDSTNKNYNDLENKPFIESVELVGNKTFEDLGAISIKIEEIKSLF